MAPIKSSSFYTPLRYPGGKGKLSNYVRLLAKENNLIGGHYAEVYAGGAGVAMSLLVEGFFKSISINDIDDAIYSFWWSVLNKADELCDLILTTDVTIDEWYKQREIFRKADEDLLKLGFATFFLNRCNRSGILKAGVIGGKAQSGKWKLDVRYNKVDLIQRIKNIAALKNKVTLTKMDALDFVLKVPENALVYLDPPYYNKGKGLYRNYYNDSNHVEIRNLVHNLNNMKWFMSYDNVPRIKELYASYKMQEYSLSYTAQNKIKGSELLIFSDNLVAPEVKNPSKIKIVT